MPAILITGGAGYIGAHVCQRLSREGWLPVTLDNLSTGHREAVRWGPLYDGEITCAGLLDEIKRSHSLWGAAHLAALADVGRCERDQQQAWSINVRGTSMLKEAFGELPFVLASTAAVYGDGGELAETAPLQPLNCYGATKAAAERLMPDAIKLRLFNVAGAGDGLGEEHEPETHVIPNVLKAAKADSVFTIEGAGEAVRDFVHVADVADAVFLALRALRSGAPGCPLNICTGEGRSVQDVLRTACKVTGRRIKATPGERRPGDVPRLVGKNDAAKACLGWSPKHSFEDQVASAWRFINGHERKDAA